MGVRNSVFASFVVRVANRGSSRLGEIGSRDGRVHGKKMGTGDRRRRDRGECREIGSSTWRRNRATVAKKWSSDDSSNGGSGCGSLAADPAFRKRRNRSSRTVGRNGFDASPAFRG